MPFAAPLWLAALAAVALPLLIHLLSRGHQRRVRVGSVRLLQPAPGRRGRRPRLTEPGLLALRAGLLAALALALAGPRWRGDATTGAEPAGWLLVAPEAVDAMGRDAALAAGFERLRAEGHQARRLEPGLAPGLPPAGTTPDRGRASLALWSLLREADDLAPPGAPFFVFAEARAEDMDGVRPALRRRLEWRWSGAPGGEQAASAEPGPDSSAPARALEVAIVSAPERVGEERYLRAAFAALEPEAPRAGAAAVIRTATADAGDAALAPAVAAAVRAADLVFWLAEDPPPPVVLARVREGGVAVIASAAGAAPCDRLLLAAIAGVEHRVALRRCPPPPAGAAWWRDDGGSVRLTLQSLDAGLLFRHAGAFDPAFGDLVTGAAFPTWIEELSALAHARAGFSNAAGSRWPRAIVAESQATPRSLAPDPAAAGAARSAPGRDAATLLWVLVALLLATERLVVARRSP